MYMVNKRRKAKKMARDRFLDNAVASISKGWDGGFNGCYRDAAKKCGLERKLEKKLQSNGPGRNENEKGINDECLFMA